MKRTLAIAALACVLGVPTLTRSADAHWNDAPRSRQVDYRYHHASRYDRAWAVVRHDPCRYAEYRHFARHHRNPVKRRHMIVQLAYEGCRGRAVRRSY